ncbi:hypothetical protein KKG83_02640 [Candidatus Micrarchaeota archaeon]|nr:hypothetical protein [Candidatus Micrarchaeota archaeon]
MGVLAAVMGFMVPGSGQVFNREYTHGLFVFGLWILWIYLSKYQLMLDSTIILIGWFVFAGYSAFDGMLFETKKTKQEDTQLEEFDEMQKEKKWQTETELADTKEFLKEELERKYSDFEILDLKKEKGEIKAKVIIKGIYSELTITEKGEIISKK